MDGYSFPNRRNESLLQITSPGTFMFVQYLQSSPVFFFLMYRTLITVSKRECASADVINSKTKPVRWNPQSRYHNFMLTQPSMAVDSPVYIISLTRLGYIRGMDYSYLSKVQHAGITPFQTVKIKKPPFWQNRSCWDLNPGLMSEKHQLPYPYAYIHSNIDMYTDIYVYLCVSNRYVIGIKVVAGFHL